MVLASTDYDWKQAEEKTVLECLECNNKQIKVDCKLLNGQSKHIQFGSVF